MPAAVRRYKSAKFADDFIDLGQRRYIDHLSVQYQVNAIAALEVQKSRPTSISVSISTPASQQPRPPHAGATFSAPALLRVLGIDLHS
jgi:hypothetical protein